MSLKIEFVERHAQGEKVAPLCREFGISRTAGHKWIKRFEALGYAGLDEESRRPKTTPLATAEDIVMAVIEARDSHPRWGPRKLAGLLHRRLGEQTPSARTIARILKRANRIRVRRKRRPLDVVEVVARVEAHHPNDVWTVDFKGWWKVADGERCEPLTVRDAFSRFVLEIVPCRTTVDATREVFERLFRKYGVPKAIQCDNGTPFVSTRARAGLTHLSAWWVALDIRLIRSRPGCPQDNGAHERMHADVSGDVQSLPAEDVEAERRCLSRWRQELNHVRPHDALGGKVPADVYKVSELRRANVRPYMYPTHMTVRRVAMGGSLALDSEKLFVSAALVGHNVGLERIDATHVRAWFRGLDLGTIEVMPEVHDDVYCLSRKQLNMQGRANAAGGRRLPTGKNRANQGDRTRLAVG